MQNALWREEYEKEGENKKNIRDRYGYMLLNIRKKQLLESGKGSAMDVPAWLNRNLLFKGPKYARNIVFCWYSGTVSGILEKLSGCFFQTEYF